MAVCLTSLTKNDPAMVSTDITNEHRRLLDRLPRDPSHVTQDLHGDMKTFVQKLETLMFDPAVDSNLGRKIEHYHGFWFAVLGPLDATLAM